MRQTDAETNEDGISYLRNGQFKMIQVWKKRCEWVNVTSRRSLVKIISSRLKFWLKDVY